MRKIILFIASSLDGYIAGPDGELDWLFNDEDYGYANFINDVSCLLMGRKTWDLVRGFGAWPYGDLQGYVFSSEAQTVEAAPVTFVTTEPQLFIEWLRHQDGGTIWLVGGGELIRSFLDADLIDELVLSLHPLLLGGGKALFPPGFQSSRWLLKSSESFESGLVQLRYVKPEDEPD